MKLLRDNLGKLLILIGIGGFGAIGFLLFTHHAGFAIKITNYIYYIVFIGVVFGLSNHVKK